MELACEHVTCGRSGISSIYFLLCFQCKFTPTTAITAKESLLSIYL